MSVLPPNALQPDCLILPNELSPPVPAHSAILASGSLFFANLIKTEAFQKTRTIHLSLPFANASGCVQSAVNFLYQTHHQNMAGVHPKQVLELAQQTEMLRLNQEINNLHVKTMFEPPAMLNPMFLGSQPSLIPGLDLSLLGQPNTQLLQMILAQIPAFNLTQSSQPPLQRPSVIETAPASTPSEGPSRRRRIGSESSALKKQSSIEDDEILITSSDKEGWCRNKKYIEKTENGFMCTVCKRLYGRYNSVSYHVTIYHRNPPIRCNFPDCRFATREARYIHFHKHYRHGVPLPDSIDQGTRKCPHCKHVSKSPAMLEKHIKKHGVRPGSCGVTENTAEMRRIFNEIETRPRAVSEITPPMDIVIDVSDEAERKAEEAEPAKAKPLSPLQHPSISNLLFETKARALTL